MNRRDLLKIFGGLALAPFAIKAVTPATPTEPTPDWKKGGYHPRVGYMQMLEDMGGVTFTDRPCFYVDWKTMGISYMTDIHHPPKNFMLVSAKTIKIGRLEYGLKFVEANKRNIVVCDFFLQPCYDYPGWYPNPGVMLSYVHKPGALRVYPA